MSFERKRFIVLMLGDTESWGFDEHTLPMLLALVDASEPDCRKFTHAGVIANYLTSSRALRAVEQAIAKAEGFRDTDSRFATLGIGLAEGELLAEFDELGRLKTDRNGPLGAVLVEASKCERAPSNYKETLQKLQARVHASAA